MRIALLSYSTKPRGGVVHTLALAEAMAAEGADVTVWTLGRGGDSGFFRPVDDRVAVRVVPFEGRDAEGVGPRILRSIDTMRAAFRPGDYDIVHAQDCISANAVDECLRTVHHIDHFSTPELAACHERAITRPYAHVCVSDAIAGELAEGWGIEAEVIPNGVESERFVHASSDADGKRRWREKLGRYVVSVGGIEPRKGTLDLLEAYALLRSRDPELNLVIVGGETLFDYRDYRARFDARAEELGVDPIVLGAVENDDLPLIVAAASAFGFPSTKEGFGLAAMEALAAGVPVVTRDLPVLREVFGRAVRLASEPWGFADALADAVRNPGARRQAGLALARRYSWANAARGHLELYRRLAGVGGQAVGSTTTLPSTARSSSCATASPARDSG
ncbi:MSMEG_0565 family glycosyltransferase [Prauserella rugosa]|uniref:Glycosyltransferase-like protein n=1 Tax=Prauserella rugosa TaxID=43354 RepID=A0A660C4R3_9PSEU|nr:MSMEG_0565 family glycosyltransferase [Prauserella rugosa]KID29763.1 glycosyltransferase, MSMEG_0565 family [Prauserella sp. Am3]TWH18528.1 glycosyltransferase-like protein [Prauserella rugosa]